MNMSGVDCGKNLNLIVSIVIATMCFTNLVKINVNKDIHHGPVKDIPQRRQVAYT